ncbi:hypothetical protein M433DRAFT_150189 [Acidomyces richmondensis BFW]|nr:MAG: hypothetical protein FE78DRAFT_94406 [Acidomyces sp. 'richmondensis']KYG49234.1 hypothetical protein M433DRAFT_150189 [Acidomyces richmondensis BFW]
MTSLSSKCTELKRKTLLNFPSLVDLKVDEDSVMVLYYAVVHHCSMTSTASVLKFSDPSRLPSPRAVSSQAVYLSVLHGSERPFCTWHSPRRDHAPGAEMSMTPALCLVSSYFLFLLLYLRLNPLSVVVTGIMYGLVFDIVDGVFVARGQEDLYRWPEALCIVRPL